MTIDRYVARIHPRDFGIQFRLSARHNSPHARTAGCANDAGEIDVAAKGRTDDEQFPWRSEWGWPLVPLMNEMCHLQSSPSDLSAW